MQRLEGQLLRRLQPIQTQLAAELIASHGRPLTLRAIRSVLGDLRTRALTSEELTLPDRQAILIEATALLEKWTAPTLVPVINATGVIIHTNLGRAPLSDETLAAMRVAAQGYSNLEYDLDAGARGSRHGGLRTVPATAPSARWRGRTSQ